MPVSFDCTTIFLLRLAAPEAQCFLSSLTNCAQLLAQERVYSFSRHTVCKIVAIGLQPHQELLDAVAAHDNQAAEAAMITYMRFEEENMRCAFAGIVSDQPPPIAN